MKEQIKNIFVNGKRYFIKHEPELLVGIGIAGMISSTILAVKATPKALKLIELEKNKRSERKTFYADNKPIKFNQQGALTVLETIKTAWKPYLYPVILTVASSICIIRGTTINAKRNAALTTAYAITENAFSTYRNKVIETIGEKKEQSIRNKIAQDDIDKDPPVNNQVVITANGNTLFKDSISERYFRSDINKIRNIINELNRKMMIENYISLDEFYYELGLKPMKQADRLGWEIDDGLLEVYFNACLAENDEPCIVLSYNIYPKYGYDKLG
jgi:hypothetical protein